jgi:imidazolonepropionase-like amidohydrolase
MYNVCKIVLKFTFLNLYSVLLVIFASFLSGLKAQPIQNKGASFIIYKLCNPIGIENYTTEDSSLSKIYSINYSFNDRGSKNKLITRFKVDKNNVPQYLISKGFASRWASVEENIQVSKSINKDVFPIIKFSPAIIKQFLVDYWKKNNEPGTIYSYSDSLQIKITKEGYDSVLFADNTVLLQRLKIEGLVWGNEFVWINEDNELVFVLTNDAEGDKTEIISKFYESLFPKMLSISSAYAIDAVAKKYPASKNSYSDIVIIGGNMIDVIGKDSVVNNSMIIIHDGIIKYAGKNDTLKIPAHAFVINANGKYILPGLWDMHAHLMQAEWLPKYISQGVTTVRDCGNEFDFINALQREVEENKIMGPQIIKAGLIDGVSKNALGAIQTDTKEGALNLVNKYKAEGFAQIKIYSNVKTSVLKAICKEAHRLDMTVTGHIPYGNTATTAINKGIDMVSHISYFRNSILTSDTDLQFSDKGTKHFITLLQTKKTVLDPTLSIYENADPYYIKNIPYYKTVINRLNRLGIPIIAGTDMNSGGIVAELTAYVDAGFTELQAIRSATIIPAQVMKMANRLGNIEEGKSGDIILIEGNPLLNIKNLNNIKTVIKGKYVFNF